MSVMVNYFNLFSHSQIEEVVEEDVLEDHGTAGDHQPRVGASYHDDGGYHQDGGEGEHAYHVAEVSEVEAFSTNGHQMHMEDEESVLSKPTVTNGRPRGNTEAGIKAVSSILSRLQPRQQQHTGLCFNFTCNVSVSAWAFI